MTGSHTLDDIIALAKAQWAAMTPEQQDDMLRAQRESWVRGEMGMGSDRDEAAYRARLAENEALQQKALAVDELKAAALLAVEVNQQLLAEIDALREREARFRDFIAGLGCDPHSVAKNHRAPGDVADD